MANEALTLRSPISALPGVGEPTARRLTRLGIGTVQDLLEWLPFRFEDRSHQIPIAQLPYNQESVIGGVITEVFGRKSKRGVFMVQVKLSDESGQITAVWFNQRFLLGQLKQGQELLLFGSKRPLPSLNNPFFVKKMINRLEVAPIYPTTAGLAQGVIRRLLDQVKGLTPTMPDLLPEWVRDELQLSRRGEAVAACHFSQDPRALKQAESLLGFEELLFLCLQAQLTRRERLRQRLKPLGVNPAILQRVVARLPFSLTAGQKRAAWEIIQDLTQPYPMNRLLYGEVGAGKTVIAALVAMVVISQRRRVLWLNPTVTLADQQAAILKSWLEPIGVKVALISSQRKERVEGAALIIGTHAVIGAKFDSSQVGLVVVDEQHRFGVEHRKELIVRHPKTHLLMMSATPIPRTLAQTIFGHLDVTYLKDRPAHQQPIETVIFTESERAKVEKEIAQRLERGEPGYVICPLIQGSTAAPTSLLTLERKTILNEAGRLKKTFPSCRLGVIHGRLSAPERERVMERFRCGEIQILLATTIVEAGIDNPAATWILVEEADYFGLSQLHQLRGRVGRGARPSICFFAQSLSGSTKRLEALQEVTDGLSLAEADLALRGPGEIFGVAQSGIPKLHWANLGDRMRLDQARSIAERLVSEGLSRYPQINNALARLTKDGPTGA